MTTQARELAKLVSNSGDLNFIDDIALGSDGAVLTFGADAEITLTHVHNDGILLNATKELQFGDSGTHISQSADGVLNLTSDTEIELNATTIDINGNVDISGNLVLGGNITIGDADSDDISFGGELTSHIIPNADDTFDLGSSTKQWRNVYVDGTLEADAITVDGVSLAVVTSENVSDIVGAMFSSNTETGITATYQDGDNTIDLALVSRNIHGVAYDGSANIDLTEVIQDTVGAMVSSNTETNITVAYQDADGTLDFVVDAAQPNVTSLGTLTSLRVDDVVIDGTTIGHADDTDLITLTSGVVTVAGELDAVSLDISGDADIDGTLEADAITIGGVTLAETISDTVGAMVTSNTESGITVAYQDADNTLDFTIGTLNQNTTGTAATVTTAAQTNITSLGTLTTLTVDDITINGSTITDAGDLIFDVGGTIDLNSDSGQIKLSDAGVQVGLIQMDSGNNLIFRSMVSDEDMLFKGNDNGSTITALTLDMSASGNALFGSDVRVNDSKGVRLGDSQDFALVFDGTNSNVTAAGNLTLDVVGDIILDAAGNDIILKDNGTTFGQFTNDSGQLIIYNAGSQMLKGNTGSNALFVAGVSVTGSARGTLTTDNDGSFDMNATNNFKCTPSGNFTLTFTNIVSQSGNILLINSGGHTVSAHSNTKVDANILGTISTAGTYLLAYFSDGTNVYMTNSAVYS